MPREVHRALARLVPLLARAGPRRATRRLALLAALHAARGAEPAHVPVLERLIQTPTHQPTAVRRERNAIHTVPVPTQPLDQHRACHVPDAHNRVQAPGGDPPPIRADRDARHARVVVQRVGVVDREHLARAFEHVPDARGLVTRAGDDEPAVAREVERVDLLLVPVEHVADALLRDVPNPDLLVLRARREVLAVRAEAHRADVQVA